MLRILTASLQTIVVLLFQTPFFLPSDELSEVLYIFFLASSRLIKAYSAPGVVHLHGASPFFRQFA